MFPGATLAESGGAWADGLSQATYERGGDEIQDQGLYVALAGWEGQVLAFRVASP